MLPGGPLYPLFFDDTGDCGSSSFVCSGAPPGTEDPRGVWAATPPPIAARCLVFIARCASGGNASF